MPLARAIVKYGAAQFEVQELVPVFSRSSLDALEDAFIQFYQTRNKNLGYNARGGGRGGKASPEARKRMSQRLRGNKFALGMRHTEEGRRKMSETRKGRKTWNKGIPHTEEVRKKMSALRKGKPHSKAHRLALAAANRISGEKRFLKAVAWG